MSSFLPERYVDRAEALAALTSENWDEVVPCEVAGGRPCASQFIVQFGERAFRRPVTGEEVDSLLGLFDQAAQELGVEAGFEAILFNMLTAPPFLYRMEHTPPGASSGDVVPLNDYEIASRLSYFLLGSMPDEELFEAARQGALSTPDEIRAHAERLVRSPNGGRGMREFLRQWVELDLIEALQKDVTQQPDFEPGLGLDLRASLQRMLADLVEVQEFTVSDLFTVDDFYVNDGLAYLYDVPGDFGPGLEPVFDSQRVGVLSHPGVLALHSKNEETQLVARGLHLSEHILCTPIDPPPPDVPLDLPPIDERNPPANMRERFARHVENPACLGCHQQMDPMGFAFETYDGLGRYRTEDIYGPIDPSGELVSAEEANGPYIDFMDLNQRLANSRVVHECFAERMFSVAMARPVSQQTDLSSLSFVWSEAEARQWQVRELAIALATTEIFRTRVVP